MADNPSSQDWKGHLFTLLKTAWVLALLGVLVWFVRQNVADIADILGQLNMAWLPPIFLVEFVRRFIGSWRWAYLAHGARFNMDRATYQLHARVFFISNMFGYVPLVFATAATRVEMYKRDGVRRVETAGLHVAESGLLALSSLPLMVLAVPLFIDIGAGAVAGLFALATVGCVTALHPRLLALFYRVLGREGPEALTFQTSFTLLGFGVVAKILSAALFVLVMLAFDITLMKEQMFALVGLVAGAWLVGAVAVWAPAGLGVREGVLALGVMTFAPPEIAILVSLTARVASLLPDLVLGTLSLATAPQRRGR